MDTRSKKQEKQAPLSEDEILLLQEQLRLTQQRLVEQEQIIQNREKEAREKYDQLLKRENEFMDRERAQAEQLALAEEELARKNQLHTEQMALSEQETPRSTQWRTNARPDHFDNSISEAADGPPFRQIPSTASTVSVLLKDIQQMKNEIVELKAARSSRPRDLTSTPSRPFIHNLSQDPPRNLPSFSFKDALESVPVFSGEGATSVLKFTRACFRVREMFSPELESTIARLLRNKLKGRAYTAVEDNDFATITELTDTLKTIFGACKSVNQYRGELGNIKKQDREHIIDYISRVKDLHYVILEGETRGLGRLGPDRKKYFENETLSCFVAGLPPDFRIRLRIEGYTTLQTAYDAAIRIDKEIERDRSHFSKIETHEPRETKTDGNVRTKVAVTSKTCEHCNKPGHTPETCWSKNPEQRPPRDDRPRTEGAVCEYCTKPGHTAAQCFKKQNDEKQKSGNGQSRPSSSSAQRTESTNARRVQTIESSEIELSEPPALD